MSKLAKKVDFKKVAKTAVNEVIVNALRDAGYTVVDGADYNFTAGTVVAKFEGKPDVQVKLITPKAGIDTYTLIEETAAVEADLTESEEVVDA